jgi:RNA polymerase sigma-70 factor (ECF subfamily)
MDAGQLLSSGRRPEAFEKLVELYHKKVFRLLWQALPAYDGRASLSAWIYTIARNTALTHLRAESYRKTLPLEAGAGVSQESADDLSHLDIGRLLSRLPEDQRQILQLFHFEDRSIQELSAMLDLPGGTVKSRLHRARRALAAMMEKRS